MNLVRNYNDRHLTCPEDIIAGFSGVLSILSTVFEGGFIWGLPEMFLISHCYGNLTRRLREGFHQRTLEFIYQVGHGRDGVETLIRTAGHLIVSG
jgi:hypothetical protein